MLGLTSRAPLKQESQALKDNASLVCLGLSFGIHNIRILVCASQNLDTEASAKLWSREDRTKEDN